LAEHGKTNETTRVDGNALSCPRLKLRPVIDARDDVKSRTAQVRLIVLEHPNLASAGFHQLDQFILSFKASVKKTVFLENISRCFARAIVVASLKLNSLSAVESINWKSPSVNGAILDILLHPGGSYDMTRERDGLEERIS